MIESILTSTKQSLGIAEDETAFDNDIVDLINSAFFTLQQAGIGPRGFTIEDDLATWDDFLPNINDLPAVKTYIYLSVQIVFDPPQSSFVLEAKKVRLEELLWRLNLDTELYKNKSV